MFYGAQREEEVRYNRAIGSRDPGPPPSTSFDSLQDHSFHLLPISPLLFIFLPSIYLFPQFFSQEFSMPTMTLEFTRWILLVSWNGRFARETKCGKRNGSSIIRRMSNWNILMNVCILNNGTGRNTRQKRGNRIVGMN